MTLINNSEGGASVRSKLNNLIISEARELKDVTTLLADTNLTYTAGQPGTVVAGDIVRLRKEGWSLEVLAPGASADFQNSNAVPVGFRRVTAALNVVKTGVNPSFTFGFGLYAEMDSAAGSAWAFDGSSGFANKIGINNTSPVTGTWTNDTGYLTGQAGFSAIMGGYDNIANGLASIMASQHSMITSDADHGTIVGGSVNGILKGSYCAIYGGTDNRVMSLRLDGVTASPASHGVIFGGLQNRIYNANAGIFSSQGGEVDGQYAVILGGIANKALGNFDHVSGANNETRKGTGGSGQINTIGGGRRNIIDSPASPISSTIGGGEDNEIYGSYGFLGGGDDNVIGSSGTAANYAVLGGGLTNLVTSANGGTVSGGRSNTASGEYAAIPGGRENVASALYSFAMGYQTQATANYAAAFGYQAVGRHQSGFTVADGGFAAAGDAQASRVMRKTTTTNATTTYMTSIIIPDDTTAAFSILIAARRTDADNESAGYKVEGVIDRNAGTAALVGAITKTVLGEDNAAWDVTVIATGSGGIGIGVTGEASKTVRWVASCDLVEVTG